MENLIFPNSLLSSFCSNGLLLLAERSDGLLIFSSTLPLRREEEEKRKGQFNSN
jgi:hypothetical protein